MKKVYLTMIAAALVCSACDGGNEKAPRTIEDLDVAEEISIADLNAPVEVVVDDRGIPHVYAQDTHDALVAQGYFMARDRMGQMEFMRRAFAGRLAEVAGTLMPDLVNIDGFARFNGFLRTATAMWATMGPDDETRQALEAFSAGVNARIAEHQSGAVTLPVGLDSLLTLAHLTEWTPIDTLAIARYMTYDASPGPSAEIAFSEAAAGIAAAFPADDPDARLAARNGILHDLFPFAPAENVFSRDGLPNLIDDSGSRAFRSPRPGQPAMPLPSRDMLKKARAFFENRGPLFDKLYGGLEKGSNNWVVHGSKTASGYPLVASDPHLGLDSPAKFWFIHLNTTRAGGDLDAQGLALAGTPGMLLGYTDHVAWGLTYAGHDTIDVYHEQITPGQNGEPDTVLFNGQQVPIETTDEVIKMNDGTQQVLTIEMVPHHGPIIASSRTDTEALSIRWTGNEPTNELAAVLGMLKAKDAAGVETALDEFKVGAQCWSVITRDGDVLWTCPAQIPVRDARALTYDPATRTGVAPCFVMPGTGEYEWQGDLDDRYIPHDINPAKGFGATANADPVGLSADGNPFNDDHYIAWEWDLGHRIARVTQRLQQLVDRGDVTPEDMMDVQADHHSALGAKLNGAFVAAADRALEERLNPGTHADLTALVAGASSTRLDQLQLMRDRLEAWTSYDTPAAVEGEPTAEQIADSVATTLFNAALPRLVRLAFEDEVDAIGVRPGDRSIGRTLQWAVLEPERLASYDADLGDTVLWDDLTTADVAETRDERMVRAMLEALEYLEGKLGAEMDGWRWGHLHTVTFETLIPLFETFTIPQKAEFENGFPRPGDRFSVDASHPGLWSETDFTYSSGPQQRLVLEMTPEGPRAWNALPGGQAHDPYSPHHADEAAFWRRNEAPPLYFLEREVVSHAEQRIRLIP